MLLYASFEEQKQKQKQNFRLLNFHLDLIWEKKKERQNLIFSLGQEAPFYAALYLAFLVVILQDMNADVTGKVTLFCTFL